jgi:hypothetical protein
VSIGLDSYLSRIGCVPVVKTRERGKEIARLDLTTQEGKTVYRLKT